MQERRRVVLPLRSRLHLVLILPWSLRCSLRLDKADIAAALICLFIALRARARVRANVAKPVQRGVSQRSPFDRVRDGGARVRCGGASEISRLVRES
jgi:hypothetical protein